MDLSRSAESFHVNLKCYLLPVSDRVVSVEARSAESPYCRCRAKGAWAGANLGQGLYKYISLYTTDKFDNLSAEGIQGATAYRYNTFILNFMANPMIYRGHYKFPYISLYLESPTPHRKPGPPPLLSASVTNSRLQIWNLSRSVNPTSEVSMRGQGQRIFGKESRRPPLAQDISKMHAFPISIIRSVQWLLFEDGHPFKY